MNRKGWQVGGEYALATGIVVVVVSLLYKTNMLEFLWTHNSSIMSFIPVVFGIFLLIASIQLLVGK